MAEKKQGGAPRPTIQNRRASFEYQLLDQFTAGIMLTGTEIKSIREGKVQLQDAFCAFVGQELFIVNMEIAIWGTGGYNNHVPKRPRKLLLQRRELRRLQEELKHQGLTLIPLRIFFSERNMAKLEFALAKGKKLYDKRDSIKARENDRAMRRNEAD